MTCFSSAGHQSQFLASVTCPLLISFLKHDLISKDPLFISVVPRIIEKTKVSLTKVHKLMKLLGLVQVTFPKFRAESETGKSGSLKGKACVAPPLPQS